MHLVVKGRELGKPVVVAGCVPQADRHIKGLEDISIVGTQQVDRVVEVVEETLKGHVVRLLSKNRLPELDLPKIRKNPMVFTLFDHRIILDLLTHWICRSKSYH